MGSGGLGILRCLLVHPRGPRKERAPVMAGCACGACMQCPTPAREALERGEVADANLKSRREPRKLKKLIRTRKDTPAIANENTTSNLNPKAAN